MLQFVQKPNLPEGDVRFVLIGDAALDRLRLERFGILALSYPNAPELNPPVAAHIDMQAVHLYSNCILSKPVDSCKVKRHYTGITDEIGCKVIKLVEENLELLYGETHLIPQYPKCAAYNVLLLGKIALFNPKCIDSILKSSIMEQKYQIYHTKQGFTRCSVCVVRENAVITSDPGIGRLLMNLGIDVLMISPGYINLPGYDTGFIGGASFKLSSDKLAFTGHLNAHPNRKEILAFLAKHHVKPVFLTDDSIFDIGSAIPLIEEL